MTTNKKNLEPKHLQRIGIYRLILLCESDKQTTRFEGQS